MDAFAIRVSHKVHPTIKLLGWTLRRGRIELRFWLCVNDLEFESMTRDQGISASALLESTERDGQFYIDTCSCGEAACGGFAPIEVAHVGETVLWRDECGHYCEFERNRYVCEISKLKEALDKLESAYPAFDWEPPVF